MNGFKTFAAAGGDGIGGVSVDVDWSLGDGFAKRSAAAAAGTDALDGGGRVGCDDGDLEEDGGFGAWVVDGDVPDVDWDGGAAKVLFAVTAAAAVVVVEDGSFMGISGCAFVVTRVCCDGGGGGCCSCC